MLAIERLTAQEIASLDLGGLYLALSEIVAEIPAVAARLNVAESMLADARMRILVGDPAPRSILQAKADTIGAKLAVTHLANRARMLRQSSSLIQTLIRAVPAS